MKRLLIANRGEIAVRIIRAAKELGIETVAIYSDPDAGALHTRLADKKIALRGAQARDTYLHIEKVIQAATQAGADAIHPGYGFLSENSRFAAAVQEAELVFVGPDPSVMAIMGDKAQARKRVSEFGVPVVPGFSGEVKELKHRATEIGYPVLIKAVAGGGGRGMRVVEEEKDFTSALSQAQQEAASSFANSEVLIEKYISKPRHIEVQVFGDISGNILHCYERECSIQRRHQKIIEEAEAPNLTPKLREKILAAAVNAARSVHYTGAGTIEFLVQGGMKETDPFYFLEMNTRIQVEHPVTEFITGLDLVKLQLEVANGEKLPQQSAVRASGHAIEFRISAEDVTKQFQPTSGTVRYVSRAFGPGIREDSWIEAGTKVSPYYDSLLSKLIVFASTRSEALQRARRLMQEYVIEGIETTLPFHRWILEQDDFCAGQVDVKWVERNFSGETPSAPAQGPLRLPSARLETENPSPPSDSEK